jgi:hypothetical protein
MKQISLIVISTVLFSTALWLITFSAAHAVEKHDCIYASKIDQTISFYQGRLYLVDSEHKILSDVGKDAIKMINCLEGQKESLVTEMKKRKIDFSSQKMRAYVVNRARFADIVLGYTAP